MKNSSRNYLLEIHMLDIPKIEDLKDDFNRWGVIWGPEATYSILAEIIVNGKLFFGPLVFCSNELDARRLYKKIRSSESVRGPTFICVTENFKGQTKFDIFNIDKFINEVKYASKQV